MEHINKIVIRGTVGTVRLQELCSSKVANFSVATTMVLSNMDGNVISDITWHNVVAWDSVVKGDITKLEKGVNVRVEGRVRNTRYTAADGTEKMFYEVLANEVEIIKD